MATKNSIYFRQVNFNKERPRLYDLLKELELNDDSLAGIILWKPNAEGYQIPYVLATEELAHSTVKLCQACQTGNITPRDLRALRRRIDKLPPPENGNKILQEWLERGELLDEQIESCPFDMHEHMATILWDCGLERADHEAILSWIKVKFPKAAEKYQKIREKYHF